MLREIHVGEMVYFSPDLYVFFSTSSKVSHFLRMTGQQDQMGPWDSCLLQPGRLYRYATSLYEGFLTVRRVETGLVPTYQSGGQDEIIQCH